MNLSSPGRPEKNMKVECSVIVSALIEGTHGQFFGERADLSAMSEEERMQQLRSREGCTRKINPPSSASRSSLIDETVTASSLIAVLMACAA